MPSKKKPSKVPKKRNLAAKQSVDQKAGPMKVKKKELVKEATKWDTLNDYW